LRRIGVSAKFVKYITVHGLLGRGHYSSIIASGTADSAVLTTRRTSLEFSAASDHISLPKGEK